MAWLDIAERVKLSERIRELKAEVAEKAGREFAGAHPESRAFGEEVRWHLGAEGVRHHIDFLAGAVGAGSTTAFADYAKWSAGVLQSRGAAPHLLAETLRLMNEHLGRALGPPGSDTVSAIVLMGRAACLERREPPAQAPLSGAVFLQAILQGNRRAAQKIVDELARRGQALLDIYTEVFEPALIEVGRLWERTEISTAVEHMATAVTQFLMARLFSSAPMPDPVRGKAVITGVEGDQHQIGAHMIADALSISAWDVRFLGADVPQAGVLEVIGEHKPALVGISSALLSGIPRMIRLLGSVRGNFPEIRVIVGGGAFRNLPELWKQMGADGWAPGVRPALEMVERLFPAN